jgi:hypothetical protein
LGDERDPTARLQQLPQLTKPLGGLGPEPERVDGEHRVERRAEVRQPVNGSMHEVDVLAAVAPTRQPNHDLGVIDPVDVAGSLRKLGDGDPGPETDLEHPIGGLYVE